MFLNFALLKKARHSMAGIKTLLSFSTLIILLSLPLAAQEFVLKGRVVDPQGSALPKASVQVLDEGQIVGRRTTGDDGMFQITFSSAGQSSRQTTGNDAGKPTGEFLVKVEASGFRPVEHPVSIARGNALEILVKMAELSSRIENVTVTANVNQSDILSPDPAEKVFVRQDLLDANPGRPGAPVSIPGYPIETASSGIKAPQYFAPGVAGDHGEPIAQYIGVGSYLVPNNLSANAHGNGYSDPNIFIPEVLESVQIDGGAFNVREGNHSVNLATTYSLRSHLDPFFTLTGDNRDITATTGFSPSANSWVAIEGSFGNGFLDRLEHRKQFKFNDGQVLHAGDHTL